MSDWQPGDLALCIALPHPDRQSGLRRGGIYTVESVHLVDGATGLFFVGHRDKLGSLIAWNARGFRKIPPHRADAEDIETIRLLNGKPVPVEAA